MRKYIVGLGVLVVSALPALADPVEGLWKTEVDDGAYAHVDVHACPTGICGTITRTFNDTGEYQSPNIGKDLILGMKPNGEGHYKGNVWRPSNDKIYLGKLELNGNKLKMKGCVAGGLFCSSQTWTRIE